MNKFIEKLEQNPADKDRKIEVKRRVELRPG